MKCPACGTRNNFYHRYCYFCGEKLGAMIDPPDQDDRSPYQDHSTSAGDRALSSHDDHNTISQKTSFPIGYMEKEDYTKESYFTQENQSVDMPEDYFGYPTGDDSNTARKPGMDDTVDMTHIDDIDYYGPSPSPRDESAQDPREDIIDIGPNGRYVHSADFQEDRPVRDMTADTASGNTQYYAKDTSDDTAATAEETISSIEADIAAKISYMEKYMDDYLSGRIKDQDTAPSEGDQEGVTPSYNDSLDFISNEEKEPARRVPAPEPKPEPKPEPRQEQKPKPRPEPRFTPRPEPRPEPRHERPAPPPPPPPPTDADIEQYEYDPYEDEETSKMIDMLYQSDTSSRDSSYPRRSHRHASVKDTETAEEPQDNPDGNIVVKVMIALVIISLMAFAGYVLYNEFFNPNKVSNESSTDLLVTHTLDYDTQEDGTSGQRLTLYAPGGATAIIFGDTYTVEDNKIQQFFSDEFLLQQYQAAGDAAEGDTFTVIATVYGTNGKTMEHPVTFSLSDAAVQLAVISPEGDTIVVQGSTCTLEISVQLGAQLYINDVDYTDRVGEDGLATIDVEFSGTEDMPVNIRASLDGYADAEKTITLTRTQTATADSLITLNESIPVAATSTEVVLTGQVPAGATIESSLPLSGNPSITENGAFSLTVQIKTRPGYSVCVLRVLLDGTQVDQQEVIIDKTATFNDYTTGPWEFSPYESYKNDPELHEGYRFKIPGTIKEIISQSDGLTVCTVDANPGGTEQLIRVWFWGDFSQAAGSSVTVYGNRWGNEENVPRILAKYIVSN